MHSIIITVLIRIIYFGINSMDFQHMKPKQDSIVMICVHIPNMKSVTVTMDS